MEWYKGGEGARRALEGVLVLGVVCVLGVLLAGGLSLVVVRAAAGVIAALALG